MLRQLVEHSQPAPHSIAGALVWNLPCRGTECRLGVAAGIGTQGWWNDIWQQDLLSLIIIQE